MQNPLTFYLVVGSKMSAEIKKVQNPLTLAIENITINKNKKIVH